MALLYGVFLPALSRTFYDHLWLGRKQVHMGPRDDGTAGPWKKNGTALRSTTDGVDLPQGTHAKGLYCKAMCSYTIEGNPAGLAQVIVNFHFHGKNLSSIIFAGESFGAHVKPINVDTHREQKLLSRYPIVHSCSKDTRWLVRENIARITHTQFSHQ